MKNLFVLPTPNPSRVYKNLLTNKLFILENSFMDVSECNREYQNIYITDNSEIKKGDWIVIKNIELNRVSTIKCETENQVLIANSKSDYNIKKKIILTTDQYLIADGIQSIDDEFLEWFCKNSSCEFVEVVNDTLTVGEMSKLPLGTRNHKYKIEEPKQRLEKYSERFDNKDNEIVEGIFNPDTWGKRMVDDIDAEMEKQISLTQEIGEKIVKYLDKYKGQSIYNEIAVAIEFGYQLKLEEDEKQ